MLNRRDLLSILGTAGIGTAVFQRALAAQADNGPVTAQMVAQAEWIAGIALTDRQREAAHDSQSLEPARRRGWFIVGIGSSDGGGAGRLFDRDAHRRQYCQSFDAVRRRGVLSDLWPCQPLWLHATELVAGQSRTDLPHGR